MLDPNFAEIYIFAEGKHSHSTEFDHPALRFSEDGNVDFTLLIIKKI